MKQVKLFLFLLALLAPLCGWAINEGEARLVGDYYYYLHSDGTATLVMPENAANLEGEIHILGSIEVDDKTYSVTTIGPNAFEGAYYITKVTIPKSIISIGDESFAINGLAEVSFEGNSRLSDIGKYAFSSTALENIELPNSVKNIGEKAFYQCQNLVSIAIPNGIKKIEAETFRGCSALQSASIPASVESIMENAFFECEMLASAEIPIGMKYIGIGAFYGCEALTSVIIPEGVTKIDEAAFQGCKNLESVSLPSTIEAGETYLEICDEAFSGCDKLTVITSYIENPKMTHPWAFDNSHKQNATLWVPSGTRAKYEECWGFAHIEEMNGVADIIIFKDAKVKAICVTNWDKNGDRELSKTEASAVTSLGGLFKGNKEISSFDELQYFTGLTKLDNWAFGNCTNLKSVTLPATMTEIGMNALMSSGLTSLNITASVTTIGEAALSGCKNLTAFTVDAGNNHFTTADGILYNKTKTVLISCPAGKAGTASLPATVTTIEGNGFYNCSRLTAISLPVSLTTIRSGAFVGCSGLTNLTLPEYLRTIGKGCFTGCTNLQAFTVEHSPSNPFWHYGAFDGVLYQTKVTGEPYALVAYPNKRDDTYTVLDGIGYIEEYAFYNTDIKDLTLPSLYMVGFMAFASCEKLTKVTSNVTAPTSVYGCFDGSNTNATLYIPKGTKELYMASGGWEWFTNIVEVDNDKSAEIFTDTNKKNFYKVTSENTVALVKHVGMTQNLVIQASVSNNGKTYQVTGVGSGEEWGELLSYSPMLKEVEIPNGVKIISGYAFYNCNNLASSLTIPNSVEEIGDWAFDGCPISNLHLGSGLKIIGEGAFCTGTFPSVTLPSGLTTIKSCAFNTSSLKEVSIPASVTFIGNYAFQTSLQEQPIRVNISDVDAWCRVESDGDYWEDPIRFYNLYKDGKEVTDVNIPEGVTSISKVFLSQMNLKTVHIPSTVTEIGTAFYWCQNLNTVLNFRGIPQPINTYYKNNINTRASTDESYTAFENVDKENCTLYVPAGSGSRYSAANEWKKFNIVEVLFGDANGDGFVNMSDVNAVKDYILTGEAEDLIFLNADVNGDFEINATDIVKIISIIKNSGSSSNQ